jgi:hypothetical protein
MSTETETPPRKPITEELKPITDRPSRERTEHPDLIPPETEVHHPVTRRPARRERERAC